MGNTNQLISSQKAHENSLKVAHRKDFGIFLTNNITTVDNVLSIVDFNSRDILTKRFLEPACGNGVFIIRLLEKILKQDTTIEIATKFISNSIFFVDIDEGMVEKTKANIKKYFLTRFNENFNGTFNSYVFDFTQRIKPKESNNLFDTLLDVPLKECIENIDYVIGNPPYVSLYGRRDRKKDEAQRAYYLSRYSQFPRTLKNGKINFVMLFIEQSIDMLTIGGKLSFIIDLAFFETAYEHTRKYLLENTKILSIEYNIKDFEVASGQVILQVQKEKVKNNNVKIIDAETNTEVLIDQSEWNKPKDQYKFRFNTCNEKTNILTKIDSSGFQTLKELYPKKNLRTCVMLLNMENLFVFEKENKELNVKIYPYYQGSKGLSEKYGKLYNGKFFHYNKELQDKVNDELKAELTLKGIKNKKRLGLGETVIYDNPKIYIRQSAKEIVATYDANPSSANNSLYVFSLRDSSNQSIIFLKFLCGLLNSDLITFYAQEKNIIRFSKGKQPQIKTSDLYTIPIISNVTIREKIAELVDAIYKNDDNEDSIQKINDIVYEEFKITENEIAKIKDSITTF